MAQSKPQKRSFLHLFEIEIFGKTIPWYWSPILMLTIAIVSHLMIKLQIKDTTFAFLNGFSWMGEGEFRNSDYSLGGRVESTDLVIGIDPEDSGALVRIPRVRVETPGFFWLLRTQIPSFSLGGLVFGKKPKLSENVANRYPPTERLDIVFEAIDWGEYGSAEVLPDVSWVGPYSGAPFEAAGCREDWWWHRDEFVEKFRLPTPPGDIRIQFRVESEQILLQTLEFGTAETSHAIIERRFELPEADDFLDTPTETWRTVDVRWAFRDHGFNKARNRYCAEQAGISEAAFLDRHVAAVERIMASKGLRFPRGTLLAYRRFAEGGKEIAWQSNYGEGVAYEDISDKRGAALFRAMNASISVEGFPRVPYQPEVIARLPLPKDRDYASIYEILILEGGGVLPASEAVDASADAATLSATDPVTQPASSVTAVSAPVATAAVAQPPAQIPVQTSAPIPAQAPASPPTEPAPLASGAEIASRDLGKHIGRYVRVELSTGRNYVGAIEKSDANAVTLKVRLRSGQANLALRHKQIRRVTML